MTVSDYDDLHRREGDRSVLHVRVLHVLRVPDLREAFLRGAYRQAAELLFLKGY